MMEKKSIVSESRRRLLKGLALLPFAGSFSIASAASGVISNDIRWAYENGADFVCLGMYDFQVVDDVNTTIDILGSLGKCDRPWFS
jgi:hypothetical protein